MANPDPYTRGYGFANYQSSNPTSPLPGNRVDVELDDISDSLNQTQTALQDIRRSDGALNNGIVTPESFSTSSLALMQDWNFRGAWETSTAYAANDIVSRAGATYVVPSAYTSSSDFDTDLENGDLLLFANPQGALGQIVFMAFDGDGTTVSFNVGVALVDPKQVQVFVDGGIVSPEVYGVSGNNIVLDDAPPVGVDNVLVFGADLAGVASASAAAASASAAAASASASSASETTAVAAAAAAEAALEAFEDIYLGPYSSDPTTDNDGGPLEAGDLYFNTAVSRMKVYTGSAWDFVALTGADYLQVANNLSDLGDTADARSNLGLGSAATLTLGQIQSIAHPVGSLYFSVTDGNPATTLGFGTWVEYAAGQAIIGAGTHTDDRAEQRTFAAGDTEGEYQHDLVTAEIPPHEHQFNRPQFNPSAGKGVTNGATWDTGATDTLNTNSAGGGDPHNNMQPSIAVYIWRRTA